MNDLISERSREMQSYAIGYGSSLLLTLAAFAVVHWPAAGSATTFGIVVILGLIQLLVQFRFFLHVSLRRSSRTDLLLISFSALIILLMVSGTLVVLFNLRARMM